MYCLRSLAETRIELWKNSSDRWSSRRQWAGKRHGPRSERAERQGLGGAAPRSEVVPHHGTPPSRGQGSLMLKMCSYSSSFHNQDRALDALTFSSRGGTATMEHRAWSSASVAERPYSWSPARRLLRTRFVFCISAYSLFWLSFPFRLSPLPINLFHRLYPLTSPLLLCDCFFFINSFISSHLPPSSPRQGRWRSVGPNEKVGADRSSRIARPAR